MSKHELRIIDCTNHHCEDGMVEIFHDQKVTCGICEGSSKLEFIECGECDGCGETLTDSGEWSECWGCDGAGEFTQPCDIQD